MSDASLRLIPEHPHFLPEPQQLEAALAHLRQAFPAAESLTVELHEQPVFVDAGSNFGWIRCPQTGQELSLDWWQAAMDQAWQGEGFGDLTVILPTTGQSASLQDLVYEWPLGFARCVIEITASQHPHDMPALWLRELGSLLHCRLRLIWRHG